MIPPLDIRRMLINETISRQNKLWIATAWKQTRGWYVEHRWAGEEPTANGIMHSRLQFQFEPDGEWHTAKSYEEDVKPKLKWAKEMKG